MVMPGLLDRFLARKGYEGQLTSEPRSAVEGDNLFHTLPGRHSVHGRFDYCARNRVWTFNPFFMRLGIIPSVAVLIFLSAFLTALFFA